MPCLIRGHSLPAFLAAGVLWAGACHGLESVKPFTAALVIGNSHYTSVGGLRNPENDANDVCAVLRSIGFQATCLVDVDTRARLRAVIEDFVDSLPDGAVSVIYYAGHGLQVDGENYLVPTSARLTDEASVPETTVSLSFLMRQLKHHAGYLNVVILDACRNNPLASAGRPLAPGLAQITDIPDATQVVFATAASEPAVDGTGRNGTFTGSLLQHLREPGTVDDLFKEVSQAVQSETASLAHTQKPALYTNFSGQYCLVQCTNLETLQSARKELDAQQKRLEEVRRQDEAHRAAQKQEQDRQKNPIVPPSL
jgi:uncharacterized caspase-like protein